MRIKKIAPVTPANGNIKNSYGTSQTDTYSQEFLNNLHTYSTDETRIGTYLGKPLYRKVIIASNLTINQNNDTTFDDTNLEIRNIGGRIIGGGSNFVAPINSVWNTSDISNGRCSCYYITNGKLRSYCGAFLTSNNKYDLEAVIEYTKTTD